MTYQEIINLFYSDNFSNDIWSKIDHIQSKTSKYTEQQLLEIYDQLT